MDEIKKRIVILPLVTLAVILLIGATYLYFDWVRAKREYAACNIWQQDQSRRCTSDDECTTFNLLGCPSSPFAMNKTTASFLQQQLQKCQGFWPQAACIIPDRPMTFVPRCEEEKCVVKEE